MRIDHHSTLEMINLNPFDHSQIGILVIGVAGLIGFLAYRDFITPCPDSDLTRLLQNAENAGKEFLSDAFGLKPKESERFVKYPPEMFTPDRNVFETKDSQGIAVMVMDAAACFLTLMAALSFFSRGPLHEGYVYRPPGIVMT